MDAPAGLFHRNKSARMFTFVGLPKANDKDG
jgi:hypothetical protein